MIEKGEESKKIPKEILLFGSQQNLPSKRELRAGPLSAIIQDGVIRYVKFGETEIVRRIYMALRDQNWNTVPVTFSDWEYDMKADSFNISFVAKNQQGEIDYEWNGSIVGDSNGKISYSMSGSARSNFMKRIIGLCALFPIKECAGKDATILRRNGEKVSTSFPYDVSSKQPLPGFDDVSEVNYCADGIPVSVIFDGDQFEMEDQRSFTDASFKVYSTYDRAAVEGDPVIVGDKFAQTISISTGSIQARRPVAKTPDPTVIELGSAPTIPVPSIGLGLSSVEESLAESEVNLLKNLRPFILRGDLNLNSRDWNLIFRRLCEQADRLDVSIELALFVNPKEAESELESFKVELEKLTPAVATILVFDYGVVASSAQSVRICQELFSSYKSHPRIGGGTNRNYFDLDFVRPVFEPRDLVSYSVNPQVHAFDVSSLVEALEGQSWTLDSAHKIYRGNSFAITPVTLKPRFNPDEVVETKVDPNELPPQVDPRQMSLFAASWTAGSIKSLAENEAYSLTYYETIGWRGVIESERGSTLPARFFSKPGMVFPLFHVLADVCEMAGGKIITAKSSKPLSSNALHITGNNKSRIIVYNLTWIPQNISLHGLWTTRVKLRVLNEDTVTGAMFDALEFRKKYSDSMEVPTSGILNLRLKPYEVVTVDF